MRQLLIALFLLAMGSNALAQGYGAWSLQRATDPITDEIQSIVATGAVAYPDGAEESALVVRCSSSNAAKSSGVEVFFYAGQRLGGAPAYPVAFRVDKRDPVYEDWAAAVGQSAVFLNPADVAAFLQGLMSGSRLVFRITAQNGPKTFTVPIDGLNFALDALGCYTGPTLQARPPGDSTPAPGEHLWTRQSVDTGGKFAFSLATDSSNNIIITGSGEGERKPVLSDSYTVDVSDVLIKKYESNGDIAWTRHFGTAYGDEGRDVAVDASDNIFVAGFVGTGNGVWDEVAFVSKYDADGNELWARQFSSDVGSRALGVAVDFDGNIAVAGAIVGGRIGDDGAFVRKYDSLGNTVWTRHFGESGKASATGIAIDRARNIIIGGYTEGEYIFVRKYDPNGNEVWARQFRGVGGGDVVGVATDKTGNIVVVGRTGADVIDRSWSEFTHVFIVRKYDPHGNEVWTQYLAAKLFDKGAAVATDDAGNIVVTGGTYEDIDGANFGGSDVFVRKYDPAGEQIWTWQFGTRDTDEGRGVATDADGNVIVVGYTYGSFGGASDRGAHLFIRKYAP